MRRQVRTRPANSLILVTDPSNVDAATPDSFEGSLIAATESCIAIGTVAEIDGAVRIELTNEPTEADPSMVVVFNGVLNTPGRTIGICSVLMETLLAAPVSRPHVRLSIRANDADEPNHIVVRYIDDHH